MAINIKNPGTEQLARELATLTGESLTTAITVALRARLQQVRDGRPDVGRAAKAERIRALGRAIAPLLEEPWASQDHGELLYDDRGLPA